MGRVSRLGSRVTSMAFIVTSTAFFVPSRDGIRVYHDLVMPPGRAIDQDAVRFGAIVNRLRYERRWTLLDLGRLTGMHPTYLGVLERGRNMPTLATIVRLAAVFGMEASELMREVEQARAKKGGGA